MCGNGIYCDQEGNIYEGEFYNGKFHGFGQLTMKNEDIYIGQFSEGEFFGKGLYRKGKRRVLKSELSKLDEMMLPSSRNESELEEQGGEIYDGDFVAGKKCGEGILVCGNKRYEGIFMDDSFYKGKIVSENGNEKLVTVLNGELLGASVSQPSTESYQNENHTNDI